MHTCEAGTDCVYCQFYFGRCRPGAEPRYTHALERVLTLRISMRREIGVCDSGSSECVTLSEEFVTLTYSEYVTLYVTHRVSHTHFM